MRLFRRRPESQADASLQDIASAFLGRSVLLCPSCRAAAPLARATALTFLPCARCGFSVFVPYAVGGFVLLEPLGAGGLSSVYKGLRADDPDAVCAVKLLQPHLLSDPDAVSAFQSESGIHRGLSPHENIVRYVDSGCDDGDYYYAMEFVDGTRLDEMVVEGVGIPEGDAVAVAAQLVSALKHIHDHGILYRDVNAGNLIVTADGRAVLLDFGLALPLADAAAGSSSRYVWGTGTFMPPERIRRTGEDQRSVIYSVGMLLYFMLTGRPFFEDEELAGQARRHLSAVRLAVTAEAMPGKSDAVARIVSKAIRPEPAARFQTFDELFGQLAALA